MFDVVVVSRNPYDKVKSLEGKGLLHSEIIEMQDISLAHNKRTTQISVGDGPYGDSFLVVVKDSLTLVVTKGLFVHNGEQIYLSEDVEIPYDYTLTDPSDDYVLVCKWRDVQITPVDDPSILNAQIGLTSHRIAKSIKFSLEPRVTAIYAQDNAFIVSKLNFRKDVDHLNLPLISTDLEDMRYKYSLHFVNTGLAIESIQVVGAFVRVTLQEGKYTYLGKLIYVNTLPNRVFDIPLAAVNTDARYLIYYTRFGSQPVPHVVPYVASSVLADVPIKLFELTVNSSGVVSGSINDIRIFIPNTRRSVEIQIDEAVNPITPQFPITYEHDLDGRLSTVFQVDYMVSEPVAPNGWCMNVQTWDIQIPLGSGTLYFNVLNNFETIYQYTLNTIDSFKNYYGNFSMDMALESFVDPVHSHRVVIQYNNGSTYTRDMKVQLTCYGIIFS